MELARLADAAGVRHGVVQDKLFLPGLLKLRRLVEGGFFGRILSVRGEFGYWVFEGDWQAPKRPSWNYRAEEGGGIALDMFCHWRYVLDNVFAPVRSVSATVATHIPSRVDEAGRDVRRHGRRRGLRDVRARGRGDRADQLVLDRAGVPRRAGRVPGRRHRGQRRRRAAPLPLPAPRRHAAGRSGTRTCRRPRTSARQWAEVPDNEEFDNAFKVQWEKFLRHVADGEPFPWDLWEGAKGVQLAELGLRSAAEGRRLEVPALVPSEVVG